MDLSAVWNRSLSAAKGCANGAWGVLKERPLSTLFPCYLIYKWTYETYEGYYWEAEGRNPDPEAYQKAEARRNAKFGADAAGWLALRVIDPWLVANPVSTGLLLYEMARILHNRGPYTPGIEQRSHRHLLGADPEEPDKDQSPVASALEWWNMFGLPDLGVVLLAGAVRFGGPKLLPPPFATWIC